ncbi:PITH domain-containing protein 1 isoform X2 [Scyliorhinus torazame]|uniref:PITH domain-containing protein 1 isoform X2 n=1 Tax=Scyliorhinus torazame TaxID=75743 RepID=UPI003B58BDEF
MSGHSHGHGQCQCEGHQEPAERGLEYGLFRKIDLERLECLNEFVESDDDEELLFNIPFTGNVKLKGIIIMGGDDDTHPSEMRLYKNIPHMSFDDTGREPDQVFPLGRDLTGELEYTTKIARFSSVHHLSIHITKNFGAETTKIYYVGLRGEWSEGHRHEVTLCTYEASANPTDHKIDLITPQTHFIA